MVKKLKSLVERVSYVRILAPALAELLKPFHNLLKKDVSFKWAKEQQTAFQKVKDMLRVPHTMISL